MIDGRRWRTALVGLDTCRDQLPATGSLYLHAHRLDAVDDHAALRE